MSAPKLTESQRRILALLVALERRTLPEGGRSSDSSGKLVDWSQAFDRPRARASTRTESQWPWAIKVNSQAAAKLQDMRLLCSTFESRYGSDGHGHWGGSDAYYWITDAGRVALRGDS